ncbi:MAG: SRPBCC family protein [Solirubrobacteraceae bacterium]
MTEYGFTIRRVFDAPRERIWQEWTEPARFADWFGGPEAEIPLETVDMDVRPGGTWRATMFFGPERREISWKGEYLEVVPPERLVMTFSNRSDEVYERVTVVLNDLDSARTEMLFDQRGHLQPDEYEGTKEGWEVFFERMETRLRH